MLADNSICVTITYTTTTITMHTHATACQADSSLALQLLAELAAFSSESSEEPLKTAEAALPWAALKDAASFVYPSGTYEAADAVALSGLCGTIAATAAAAAAGSGSSGKGTTATAAFAQATARCLVHQVVTEL
jgi:hypothetical protein